MQRQEAAENRLGRSDANEIRDGGRGAQSGVRWLMARFGAPAAATAVGLWLVASVAHGQQAGPAVPPDTLITLERAGCGADCPTYAVSIDADGNVEYEGRQFVRVEDRQTDRIPRSAVAELLDGAARIGFFDLENSYRFRRLPNGLIQFTTDQRRSFISIRAGGRSKRIEDYDGTPEPLTRLEDRVDELTRTRRWTFLDEAMLSSLRERGWTPSGEELAALLGRAVRWDDLPIVRGLLEFGADPNRAPENLGPPIWSVRSAAALRALLAAGADPFTPTPEGLSLLYLGAYMEPEVTALLLRSGLPVDAIDPRTGDRPLALAVRAGNARVVDMLLAAGANAAWRDSEGRRLVELARAVERSRSHPPDPQRPYQQDYAEVIALLERALAPARR